MQFLSLIIAVIALFSSFGGNQHLFGVTQTASSDTLNTLRNNVNDLATLSGGFSTTTTNTWTQTQTFSVFPSLPLAKGNFIVGNDAGTAQATSTIFITSLGSVGIGTTTPNWTTQIAGSRPSFVISDTAQTAVSNLQHWLLSSMGGRFYLGTSTGLYATSTPAITITNTGLTGIASTSPTKQFSVNGLIYPSAGIYFNDGTTLTSAASNSGSTITTASSSNTINGSTYATPFSVVNGDKIMWWVEAYASSGCGSSSYIEIQAQIKQSTYAATTTVDTMDNSGNTSARCSVSAMGLFSATTTETVTVSALETNGINADIFKIFAQKIH